MKSLRLQRLPPNVLIRATIAAAADEHRGKRSKAEAGYENPARNPNCHCGPSGRPGRCAHFRRPRACTEVAGDIAPTGWCYYWERITGEHDVKPGARKGETDAADAPA
jgi:hypothetical protein